MENNNQTQGNRRPAGTARPAGATRPAGTARPAGATRPAGSTARPAGATRPAGSTARPAGAARPAGTATRQAGANARPAGTATRQAGANARPAGTAAKQNSSNKKPKNQKKMIAIFVAEVAVIALLIVAWIGVNKFTGGNIIGGGSSTAGVQKYNLNEEEIMINEQVAENVTMKGYRTIALFGVDTTTKTTAENLLKGNRTDCIMIASINEDTGEVKLVSVYRDTYMNLSNDTYNKANAAYAKGGPELAINMLNTNLDLNITDYITVGFGGLIQIIDAVGGVDIDVQADEIPYLNDYQISISGKKTGQLNANGEPIFTATEGKDYIKVTNSGLQTLNGLQATAYCRIRYIGNDFQRTQRQRDVLTLIVEKAKTQPLTSLTAAATEVFPYISTSLGLEEITELLGDLAKYSIVDNNGFPYEEYRSTKTLGSVGSCVLAVDLETNVRWLHEFLYGDANYEPSSTVINNSNTAKSKISSYN